jgi:uncharacterized protein YraI
MRRLTFGLAAAVAGFVIAPNLASALSAVVTDSTELRAGPAYDFPVVDSIPSEVRVNVHGCVRGYRWCDVSWRDARGWVPGEQLAYLYQGRRVTIVDYGPRIGLPIEAFAFDTYWDRYYRGRPFYGERARWRTVWREHDGGDRRASDRGRDRREGRNESRTDRRDLERTDRARERTERSERTREQGRQAERRQGEDNDRRLDRRPNREERPNVRTGRGDMERGETRGYNPPSNRGPRQEMDRGPRQDANPGRGRAEPSMGGGPRGPSAERGGGGGHQGGGGGREGRRGD